VGSQQGAETLARFSGPEMARVTVVADTRGSTQPVVLLDAAVGATAVRAQGAVVPKRSTEGQRAAGAGTGTRR
jgi:hypothetical protein